MTSTTVVYFRLVSLGVDLTQQYYPKYYLNYQQLGGLLTIRRKNEYFLDAAIVISTSRTIMEQYVRPFIKVF